MAAAGYDTNIRQINNKPKKPKKEYRDQKPKPQVKQRWSATEKSPILTVSTL